MLKYLGSRESRHATTQICTNTNRTVCASRPVHTLPFAMSFVWFPGPQFAGEHYLQQRITQATWCAEIWVLSQVTWQTDENYRNVTNKPQKGSKNTEKIIIRGNDVQWSYQARTAAASILGQTHLHHCAARKTLSYRVCLRFASVYHTPTSDAVVRFGPVQRTLCLNPEPDLWFSSGILLNLGLVQQVRFGESVGSNLEPHKFCINIAEKLCKYYPANLLRSGMS